MIFKNNIWNKNKKNFELSSVSKAVEGLPSPFLKVHNYTNLLLISQMALTLGARKRREKTRSQAHELEAQID